MGHSQDSKARSRERIVEVAAARIREAGTVEPGVAEIMKAAGLTHGGFYKHFASRDQLVEEAVQSALDQGGATAAAWVEGAEDPLATFVDGYLSAEHRDHPEAGCGVAALAGDVARGGEGLREAYGAQVRRYVDWLEAMLRDGGSADAQADGDDGQARRQAIVAVSALVGALSLSRSVADPQLADELLATVRDAIAGRALGA